MTGLLAQQAADETGRTITLIIIALLVVAVLLAALTVWYWRFTDPRKRVRRPIADEIGQSSETGGHTAVAPPVESLVNESDIELSAAEQATAEAMADDGADEWLRLTGPQAGRRTR